MILKTLHLDSFMLQSFEQIGIEEGYIKKSVVMYGSVQKSDYINFNKRKILQNLTLFEDINISSSVYDLNNLTDYGLVNLKFTNSDIPLFLSEVEHNNDEQKQKYKLVYDFVFKVLEDNVNLVRKSYLLGRVDFFDRLGNFLNPVYKYMPFKLIDEKVTVKDFKNILIHFRNYLVMNKLEGYLNREMFFEKERHLIGPYFHIYDLILDFNKIYSNALDTNTTISNTCVDLNLDSNKVPILENTLSLVKTKFTDEIKYLPYPKSLKEVIDIRNKPELKRFREVLNNWCLAFQEGDLIQEQKIRRDLKTVNRELKILESWKSYQDSEFNFWLTSVGGHIPILSNIITAVYTLGEITKKTLVKKTGWSVFINPE